MGLIFLVRGDRHTQDERQNAHRGHQRQVITYTFIQATPSAFVFLWFIISQTRPQSRDAFEDAQARRLWWNLKVSNRHEGRNSYTPHLVVVLLTVKDPSQWDALPSCCFKWLIIYWESSAVQICMKLANKVKEQEECRSEGRKDLKMFLKPVKVAKGEQIFML